MSGNGADKDIEFTSPEESLEEALTFLRDGITSGEIIGLYAFAVTEDGVQPLSAGTFSRAQAVYGAHALIQHTLDED